MRMRADYRCGDWAGKACPWQPYPTREACVEAFLDQARRHFGARQMASRVQASVRQRMLELLAGDLFGFLEPDPLPPEDDDRLVAIDLGDDEEEEGELEFERDEDESPDSLIPDH